MRRFWYAKYAVTLLASTAITFHLLYSSGVKLDATTDNAITEPPQDTTTNPQLKSYAFTKSSSYLRRRLSQGNLARSRWVVLPGNVTVHEGDETVPFRVSFDIDASNVCRDFDESGKTTLLIFVASSVDHFEQRTAIRETWGLRMLQRAYNYRVVFLVGKGADQDHLVQEGYRYGDLVQINQTESFRNLGQKSVAGLQWSKEFCDRADFVMKMDDDILVHVPNLLKAFEGATRSDPLLTCHENRMRKILRKDLLDKTDLPESYHKYEVSERELPGRFYPPYCSGMAYAFSASVRDRLLAASASTPVFFIEDVYLTGFCRHKAGVVIRPHSGVSLRPPIRPRQAACSFRDGRVTSQEVGATELRDMWLELNTQGFFCPQPVAF